ncbi:MAG: MFS transporter [Proteobacteria bacterium]|nr:MFS transporter [Pseudomonadota bacterium]
MAHTWRALRHRNFKLFFFGQSVSLIGTWMTRLATAWLVYQLTHSALLLGVVSFSGQIVSFLLGPFAAVWVERLERRRLLVITQASAALQSLSLAALTLTHVITLPEIIGLMMFQGLVNAFDMPGRQSFLVQMVEDRGDLANAIAINSSMVNGTRLIGPAIGGLIIAAFGEGYCFLIDGLSYFAVIASLLAMRLPALKARGQSGSSLLEELREGWNYVRGSRSIRTILLILALTCLLGWPYSVLLPVFAGTVLHGGAHTLGWLTAASGVGAFTSALALAMRKSIMGLTRTLQAAIALLGVGLIFFGLSHVLWLSLALMVVVGFGLIQAAAVCNTIIQSLVPDEMRARVMGYYTMAFVGAAPFGSLAAGALAQHIGAPHTVMLTGALCLAGAAWFGLQLPKIRPAMRASYREKELAAARAAGEEPRGAGARASAS